MSSILDFLENLNSHIYYIPGKLDPSSLLRTSIPKLTTNSTNLHSTYHLLRPNLLLIGLSLNFTEQPQQSTSTGLNYSSSANYTDTSSTSNPAYYLCTLSSLIETALMAYNHPIKPQIILLLNLNSKALLTLQRIPKHKPKPKHKKTHKDKTDKNTHQPKNTINKINKTTSFCTEASSSCYSLSENRVDGENYWYSNYGRNEEETMQGVLSRFENVIAVVYGGEDGSVCNMNGVSYIAAGDFYNGQYAIIQAKLVGVTEMLQDGGRFVQEQINTSKQWALSQIQFYKL